MDPQTRRGGLPGWILPPVRLPSPPDDSSIEPPAREPFFSPRGESLAAPAVQQVGTRTMVAGHPSSGRPSSGPASFDPNAAAAPDSGIFGLTTPETESAVVLVPVPFAATVSYGGGA